MPQGAAVTFAGLEQDIVLAEGHLSVDTRARVPISLPERTFDVALTRSMYEDMGQARRESSAAAASYRVSDVTRGIGPVAHRKSDGKHGISSDSQPILGGFV